MEKEQPKINALDRLLKFNPKDVILPTKTVKRKLKKLGGLELEFDLKALSNQEASDLQAEMIDGNMNGKVGFKLYGPAIKKILAGCNLFTNRDLMAHFKVNTPRELIDTILDKSDVDFLTGEIDELTGFDKKSESDIKNELMGL